MTDRLAELSARSASVWLDDHYHDAARVLSRLHDLGIDYDEVTCTLEERGLAAFDTSWRDLGGQLAAAMRNHTQQESGK